MKLAVAMVVIASGVGLCLPESRASANASVSGSIRVVDANRQRVRQQPPVVVFIEGTDDTTRARLRQIETGSSQPHISHRNRQFSPRVLPVQVGTQVDFRNDDGIFHNAFSLSRTKPFDLGIYPQGTEKRVAFDAPGLVRVYCNIHPEMVSNILVLDNSFFTEVSVAGRYHLADVPPGQFLLRTWSEQADARTQPLSLAAGERLTIDIELKARR